MMTMPETVETRNPAKLAAHADPIAAAERGPGVAPEAPSVLVVDDDPDFLAQQQANLEALGYQVLAADSESAARQQLNDHRPAIAVLDLMMGTADAGFTLCHDIKKARPEMPVILVTSAESITGYDLRSVNSTAREWMGVDAVLAKPVRLEQLKRELDRCANGEHRPCG
jgi:CheY-like chemotaxis protein